MDLSQFEDCVKYFIQHNCKVNTDNQILVALSGGADSVALLRVLLHLGYACAAAHCNFHLRGEESMRDEKFVRELCSSLGVRLHVHDFDVESYKQVHGVSVEMACRELRYTWFNELLKTDNYAVVAVAHHRDDNIETMFLNMLRGTGLSGLTGMKPRNGNVIRPLLCVNRTDVLEYLKELGQDYVTDSTNLTNDYQRNKVRNILLQDIDNNFPQGREQIAHTMSNLTEWQALSTELINDAIDSCRLPQCDDLKDVYLITALRHYQNPKLLLYYMLSPFGFNMSQCEQIAVLINDENREGNAHFSTYSINITLTNQQLIIEHITKDNNEEIELDLLNVSKLPVKLEVLQCNMPFSLHEIDGKFKVAFDTQLLKCNHIVLRRWRHGDRMRPYGMKGSRLLSDIFSDAHLTLHEKQRTWLIEADGEIIWILGMRASAHFNVTAKSQGYITIKYLQ